MLKKMLYGVSIITIVNIVIKTVQFFLLPFYTQYLSPADYGIIDTLKVFELVIIILFVMGLDTALFIFSGEKKKDSEKEIVFSDLVKLNIFVSFFILLLIVFSPFISSFLFKTNRFSFIVKISLLKAFFLSSITVLRNIPRVKYKFFLFAFFLFLQGILEILFSLFFIISLHLTFKGIIYAGMLSAGIVFFIVILFLGKYIIAKPSGDFLTNVKKYFIFSFPLVGSGLAVWIMQLSDRIILNRLTNAAEVGLYGMAIRFALPITLLVNSFQTVVLSFVFNNKDKNDEKNKYGLLSRYYFFFFSFVTLIYIPISGILLSHMVTQEYYIAKSALPVMIFASVWFGATYFTGFGISISKKTYVKLVISWFFAALNITLNYLLIPILGFFGAGLTTLFSQILLNFINLYFSFKLRKYFNREVIFYLIFFLIFTILLLSYYYIYNNYFYIFNIIFFIILIILFKKDIIQMFSFFRSKIETIWRKKL